MSTVRPLAYTLNDRVISYTRATLYRWEQLGLIKLIRLGGKTLISAQTVDDLLAGRIAIPPHPARSKRPEPIVRPHRKARATP